MLLVENDPADALVVVELLAETARGCDVLIATSMREASAALLVDRFDCVLLDLSLGDATGLDAVAGIIATSPDAAIVVLSGSGNDDELAVSALKVGAQDFLAKDDVNGKRLWRAMRYAAERKRSEIDLREWALHDPLTGLANRILFNERAALAIRRMGRHGGYVSVLFLDLDRFKLVNDSHGHDAGDELVVAVAHRIEKTLRPPDLAARLGGDEFLILGNEVASEFDALAIGERIHAVLQAPFDVGGFVYRATASIGIALTDDPRATPDELVRDADVAMYRAKRNGKARSEFFSIDMRRDVQAHLRLDRELRRAIADQQFEVYFQPVVELADATTIGVEALVRWNHPSGRVIPPNQFMAVAEETGLIVDIGRMVLESACTQVVRWNRSAEPATDGLGLSVNLSARQLADPALVSDIDRVVAASGLDPGALCLEVTETAVMADEDMSGRRLRSLKELGLQLAIDDFGTGYSSLTYLKRFPFDVLKIDRSFVENLSTDDDSASIVRAVLDLGRSLRMLVVAEGVETAGQAEHLGRLGCCYAQGFLYGAAVPAAEATWQATGQR